MQCPEKSKLAIDVIMAYCDENKLQSYFPNFIEDILIPGLKISYIKAKNFEALTKVFSTEFSLLYDQQSYFFLATIIENLGHLKNLETDFEFVNISLLIFN